MTSLTVQQFIQGSGLVGEALIKELRNNFNNADITSYMDSLIQQVQAETQMIQNLNNSILEGAKEIKKLQQEQRQERQNLHNIMQEMKTDTTNNIANVTCNTVPNNLNYNSIQQKSIQKRQNKTTPSTTQTSAKQDRNRKRKARRDLSDMMNDTITETTNKTIKATITATITPKPIEDNNEYQRKKQEEETAQAAMAKTKFMERHKQPQERYYKALEVNKQNRPILYDWAGDTFTTHKPPNTFRAMLLNPHGLAALTPQFGRVQQISKFMKQYKINHYCAPESQINPHSSLTQEMQRIFNCSHPDGLMHHTNTRIQQDAPSISQPGGVSVMIDSTYGKKFNGIEFDPLGRWITTRYISNKKAFINIGVYRVNSQPKNTTDSAWHHQLQALEKRKRDRDKENAEAKKKPSKTPSSPEKQIIEDLRKVIEKEMAVGNYVVVSADANEKLSDRKPLMNKMLKECGLVNLLESRFGPKIPPTYHMSDEAIDHIWVSPNLLQYIKQVGIAPKHFITTSDHRAILLDIDMQTISNDENLVMTPFERQRLKVSNVKRVEVYNESADQSFIEEACETHLEYLEHIAKDPEKHKEACEKLDFADMQIYNIQMKAENKLPAVHPDPWSPQYQEALDLVHDTQNIINYYKSRKEILATEVYKSSLSIAYDNWNIAKKAFEEDLAAALHATGKYDTIESAVKAIKHIEKQRAEATRIRRTIKRFVSSSLNFILIPAKSEYDPALQEFYKDPIVIWQRLEVANGKDINAWITITEREELERMLLEWQCLHFKQAHDTPLASDYWEKAMNSTLDFDTIKTADFDEWNKLNQPTKDFLEELYDQKETRSDIIRDMNYGDFKKFIVEKKKKTSTSPSGRHLGHLQASVDRPIFKAIFRLIKASLQLNYVPQRWRVTFCTLLEKISGSPMINRLRTIHIVEPEIQFISNYFWSKQFLPHCINNEGFLTDAQYGGRQGRLAHSATVKQLLIWDICHMQNIPVFSHLADARANFDRNLSHIVAIALIKRGFPISAVRYYQNVLESMIFHVRTGYGLSNESYTRNEWNRIFGDCQGLSWSAINQLVISTTIDYTYGKRACPFELQCYGKKIKVNSGAGYFVDDRVSNTITQPHESASQLLSNAQKNETLQTELLNAAGGAQAPEKCSTWLLERKTGTLQISYKTEKKKPGRISLRATPACPEREIKRNTPRQAKKYLGSKISPLYIMKEQVETLKTNIQEWKFNINHGHLEPELVVKSAKSTLFKQLEYPLIASNLTIPQSDALMGTIRKVIAQQSHYHSCIKKEITHGPLDLAGLDLPHIYDFQGELKLQLFQYHAVQGQIRNDTVYNLILISMGDHMLWLGFFKNFFNEDYYEYSLYLMQTTWQSTIWHYLTDRNLQMDIKDIPTCDFPRVNDRWLTDLLHKYIPDTNTRLKFTRVCMDRRLLTLSDVLLDDGATLHPDVIKLECQWYRESKFNWGRREDHIPIKWKQMFVEVLRMIVKHYMENPENHLGQWIGDSHQYNRAHKLTPTAIRIDNVIYEQENSGSYRRTMRTTKITMHDPIEVQFCSSFKVFPIYCKAHEIKNYVPLKVLEFDIEQLLGFNPPTDEIITRLAYQLREPFIGATDGGLPNHQHYGTHSYLFANKKGNIHYENEGVSSCHMDQRASKRFEGIGQWALMRVINKTTRQAKELGFELSTDRKYLCDNEAVTKLCKSHVISHNFFKKPHSDVFFKLYEEWNAEEGHPENITWIKSHQDQKKKLQDLSIKARLNVKADRLCHQAHKKEQKLKTLTTHYAPLLPGIPVSYRNDTKRFIAEKHSEFHCQHAFDSLKNYMKDKYYISETDFHKIQWKAIHRTTKKAPIGQKAVNMKVVHEKWITCYEQFKMGQHPTGMCPLCGKTLEKAKHVFKCQHPDMCTSRTAIDKEFHIQLLRYYTPLPLATVFSKILRDEGTISDLSNQLSILPYDQYCIGADALSEQVDVGFYNLQRAMIAKKWSAIMIAHAKLYNIKNFHIDVWERRLASAIIDRSQKIWKARCRLL